MAIADEHAFAELTERHGRELRVHCYRMLGSFDESEDLVQETLLRAWRGRESFEGRSTLRAWLYRIATNACLDFLARHPRRPRPYQVPPAVEPSVPAEPPPEIPWLQPFPDRLLEPVASADAEPEAAVVAKETIELVFLAAIQHLPPKQRAALILREVMGWSATETAEALWFVGRDAIGAMIAELFDPGSPRYFGDWRAVPTRANRQPAYAGYVRRPGTTTYRAQVLDVLRIEGGRVVEITTFEPHLLLAYDLPLTL
jgi:RNA polymerase sigma factor (sigma-70 family)